MADSFIADSFIPDAAAPPKAAAAKPAPKADSMGPVVGGIADTFGLTDRPEARRFGAPGRPGERTPLDVMLRPQGGLEHVAATMASAAPIGGAAALAARVGLPAVAGRLAGAGALGAARGATTPGESAVGRGAIDIAAAAIPEAVLGPGFGLAAGKAARGFAHAGSAPVEAIESLAHRLMGGKVLVPSLGAAKMTAQEAAEKLGQLTGKAYIVARDELASALNVLDRFKGQAGTSVGDLFKQLTKGERFQPKTLSRAAEAVRGSGAARGAADAVTTTEPEATIGAAMNTGTSLKGIATHVLPHMVP